MTKLEWSNEAPKKEKFTTLDQMRSEGTANTVFYYGYIGRMNILLLAHNGKYVGIYQTLGDTTYRRRIFCIEANLPSTALEEAMDWCQNYIKSEDEDGGQLNEEGGQYEDA